MTPEQFDRLNMVLNVLGPVADQLGGRAPEFVKDQLERVRQWGADTRLSPKQIEWLESLYAKETSITMKIMVESGERDDVLGVDDD